MNIYNKRPNEIGELSKKIDYGDFKLIVNSSGLETDSSELKDPVAFLDNIKNLKYQWRKHDINKKNLIDV